MSNSLRLQLTQWYLGFFTVLFLLFSLVLYRVLSDSLYQRLDQTLSSQAETAATLFESEMSELEEDASGAAQEVVSEMRMRGVVIGVAQGDRLLVASESLAASEVTRITEQAHRMHDPGPLVTIRGFRGTDGRLTIHRVVLDRLPYTIFAVQPLDVIEAELQTVRRILYIALPIVILIAGGGGFLLAGRSLAPLRSMAEQSRQISGANLDRRLEVPNAKRELALLAESFNELLSRLDQSFETMRRFVADASHELRTPLSILRGEADVALAKERSPAEYRESLTAIKEEAQRLSQLVEDLLNLARADAGRVTLRMEEFYLDDLLVECCRSVAPLVRTKEIDLNCSLAEDVSYRGDQELLRRLVLNLLDNAIRYTQPGGRIEVKLKPGEQDHLISVSDTGPGFAPEEAAHVFERFYRGDQARSRQEGGFGLGLSIVKWIAEAHHGRVELESSPGSGSVFTVRLHRQRSEPAFFHQA